MTRPSTLLRRSFAFAMVLTAGTTSSYAQIYCSPSYGTACNVGPGDYIQSFSTTGGSTNITNNNTGCNGSANNYIYYSSQTVTAAIGAPFNFSFTNAPMVAQYYKIYVDWNNNLSFTDLGEEVYASAGNVAAGATVTGTITVPTNASAGTKRMRIRSQFSTNPVTPCGNAMYGETEDYNVQVGGGLLGCGGIALVDTAYVVTGNACASTNLTLSLYTYSASPVIGVQWQYSSGTPAGVYTNIPGANTTPVTVPGMAGYYRAAITCIATGLTYMSGPVYLGALSNCQDSVWPGDANYDLAATNLDLLAITTSWGLTGTARSGASNSWTPQFAMNWPQVFNTGVNKKNADCDGNGTIGWSDTMAVSQNYGMVHLRPADSDAPTEKTAGLPDLFVDLAGITMTPGAIVTAPIRFGNAANPVTKIYGLAATVKMGGTAITTSPSIAVNPTWMGTAAQVLRFAKTTSGTTADFVASRITRRDTSGYGTLGTVTFSIPANAAGKVKISLQNVRVIDSTGAVLTAYNVLADSANIATAGIANGTSGLTNVVIIPNPGTTSAVEILLSKTTSIDILVVDALGKQVWTRSLKADAGTQRVSLPNAGLPAGVYSVRVRTADNFASTSLRWLKY